MQGFNQSVSQSTTKSINQSIIEYNNFKFTGNKHLKKSNP